ncbi:MAG: BrnT family toxin [Candidatus Hydrogenedentes bacterium]|nr:BrnT family toxin [Candidatus Hydrogenedentota bacterium]
MKCEWDNKKARQNVVKHAISFEEAVTVFYDPLSATFPDEDHSVRERRLVTIGCSSRGRLLVIAHTERQGRLRIISARKATAHERRRHDEEG